MHVPGWAAPIIIGIVALIVIIVLITIVVKMFWHVPKADEALLISGTGGTGPKDTPESVRFKIVTGGGAFVIPGLQSVSKLSLSARPVNFTEPCVTKQSIVVHVQCVAAFKVGDDYVSIANAARRFLNQQEQMAAMVNQILQGHVRSIVGSLTVEELNGDRDALSKAVRETSSEEMSKLGLIIDSLQIKEITDETGYIKSLSEPHNAEVEMRARIARANSDSTASQRESETAADKAMARRDSEIKQAGFTAEIERAKAESAQAGPLAEATARQAVIEQETAAAKLDAQRVEQQLEASVRRPADAEAYAAAKTAEGQRDATILAAEAHARQTELGAEAEANRTKVTADAEAHKRTVEATAEAAATTAIGTAEAGRTAAIGAAEGEAIKAKALAEAEGINARALALGTNQEAVISQQLADRMPELIRAAAEPFGHIDSLTVLDGADGMNGMIPKIIAMVGTLLPGLRKGLVSSVTGTSADAEPTSQVAAHSDRS